jgi:hypothetical protein
MKITFDTNALERAARPEQHPKDPAQADYIKVYRALTAGVLRGYFSDTIVTLEAVENNDRVQVFGSTQPTMQMVRPYRSEDGSEIVPVTIKVEQTRKPLHPKNAARIHAALQIGMRALWAPPRVGSFRIEDPDDTIYEAGGSDAQLSERLDRSFALATAIEKRGLGHAKVRMVEAKLAARHGVQESWLRSLRWARGPDEQHAVKRAIAEWADGDTVAAHYAYQNDCLCSDDHGRDSVFEPINRAWPEAIYGIKFVTFAQLAGMI